MLLDSITQVNDIKKLDRDDLNVLAEEIREFLIQKISVTGGHLGSNLGAVELTMALHLALNLPEDKIVWDVGHQSYTHKILTGRKAGFDELRQYHGMSGFPKRKESDCDVFDTGHSSTSVSAGLGLVKARDLKGEKQTIVSVLGDGSLTGGMVYEALNNAAKLETNFIIVLNDNNMSISENVGGMSKYLNNIRTASGYLGLKEGIYNVLRGTKRGGNAIGRIRRAKSSLKQLVIPGMLFEDMGITYLGPVDGHDIDALLTVINEAKRVRGAVLIHAQTQKGKGYAPAERHPARFHGAEPFDIETGIPSHPRTTANYTDVFSTVMCKLGQRDDKIVAITAAMPDGTGLKRFHNMYPDRFFDVGIAEEHAVTFAAGLAAGGMQPVVAVYSTFLQRAYDQMVHDVCIGRLPVVFAVDRAGIVGNDGETHQGILDISYLSHIPGMTVMAPRDGTELKEMLRFALALKKPVALRYPRGAAGELTDVGRKPLQYGRAEVLYEEREIALLAVGSMVETALEARKLLRDSAYRVTVVNLRFVAPLDTALLDDMAESHRLLVTLEENILAGGCGEKIAAYYSERGKQVRMHHIALPNQYIEHGDAAALRKKYGLVPERIAEEIKLAYRG